MKSNHRPRLILSSQSLELLIDEAGQKKARIRFKAKGTSMMPIIHPDDIITVTPYLRKKPDIGDIAVFRHPITQLLRIHRIVGKKFDKYLFKGDNLMVADGLIPRDNILGTVKYVQRNGKSIVWGIQRCLKLTAILSRYHLLKIGFTLKKILLAQHLHSKIHKTIKN